MRPGFRARSGSFRRAAGVLSLAAVLVAGLVARADEPDVESAETGVEQAAESKADDVEDLEAILSRAVEEGEYREATRCISRAGYERIELVGDVGVVLYGRGDKAWFNRWAGSRRCVGRRYRSQTLVVDRRSGRLCEFDSVRFLDRFGSRHVGPSCLLGEFQPISRDYARYLEESIQDR